MDLKFDLLGDPIPDNFGMRGRPAHMPTEQNRIKIRMLLAFGWTNPRIAAALRITGKTLRKHYFRELRARDEARHALKASVMMAALNAASGGNVGAIKEVNRLIERDELAGMAPPKREPRPEPIGKKEQLKRAAHSPGASWAAILGDPGDGVH